MAFILGNNGDNTLDGTKNADLIFGFDGEDLIFGGGGGDRIYSGDDHDQVLAGVGDDDLFGGRDGDVLMGQRGDDRIEGEGGHDTINGGRGDDQLEGGTGRDVYIFQRGSGHDTIEDFDRDEDLIDVRAYTNITATRLERFMTTVSDDDTQIDLGAANGGQQGVNLLLVENETDLSSVDFIL